VASYSLFDSFIYFLIYVFIHSLLISFKMKRTFFILFLIGLFVVPTSFGAPSRILNEPDSVYLFSYATTKNSNKNGLHFAWSPDKENWTAIGPEMSFLACDYGSWSTQKRMIDPFLFKDRAGIWHCIWSLNEKDGAFAHAESKDLINWLPQSYPVVMTGSNCLGTEITFAEGKYTISWLSTSAGRTTAWKTITSNFKTYIPAKEMALAERLNQRKQVVISGTTETGTIHKVAWELVDALLNKQKLNVYRNELWSETSKTDSSHLHPVCL
jgi:hypothetical protein